jgi:hypothetical protein
MGWAETVLTWMNGLSVIGDSLVTAVGTVLAAVLAVMSGVWTYIQNKRREVRDMERRRIERVDDIVTALHAEIIAGRDTASLQTETVEALYAEANAIPFGPADDTDFVFASIRSDLSILPVEVIHEIVEYYKLAAQSNLYTSDLKDPLFLKQTPDEKQKYVRNLIDLLREQESAAHTAYDALERYGISRGLPLVEKRVAAEHRRSERRHQRANGTSHLTSPVVSTPQI